MHAGRGAARPGDRQEHVCLYHLSAQIRCVGICPDGGIQHPRPRHPGGGGWRPYCRADRYDPETEGLRCWAGERGMIPVKVLAVRYLANASPALCDALGAPKGYSSLAMLTTDCDDATYIALDAATKAAEVEVAYGRSFYAGAANASTPNAGEVIGILAGQTPGAVRSGMEKGNSDVNGYESAYKWFLSRFEAYGMELQDIIVHTEAIPVTDDAEIIKRAYELGQKL